MLGINASTGAAIEGTDHIRQSIRDILTTPLGSRIMRRDFGSNLFDLVDRPTNSSTVTQIYAATVGALSKWEPRVTVNNVTVQSVGQGYIVLSLSVTDNETGDLINLSDLKIAQ